MDCMNCVFSGYGTRTCNNECGKYNNYRETYAETSSNRTMSETDIKYIIKENENLRKLNDELYDENDKVKKTMLDERRQKNNLNKLYQKLKSDRTSVEQLKKELEVANNASVFDKTRCNNLIKRLNAAETIIEMKFEKDVDKEELKKILNWIKIGGNL